MKYSSSFKRSELKSGNGNSFPVYRTWLDRLFNKVDNSNCICNHELPSCPDKQWLSIGLNSQEYFKCRECKKLYKVTYNEIQDGSYYKFVTLKLATRADVKKSIIIGDRAFASHVAEFNRDMLDEATDKMKEPITEECIDYYFL